MASRTLTVAISDFQAGMEKFVQMFADSYGIKLVFRGTAALTNGKIIVVPELTLLAQDDMDEEQVQEALDFLMTTRGFVYHEGAHIIFSDFKIVEKAGMRGMKFKLLVNMLEDIRIEYRISKVYPGAKEALVFTNEWTLARAAEALKEKPAGLFIELLYALGMIGNVHPEALSLPLWKQLSTQAKELGLRFKGHVERAKHTDCAGVFKIAEEIWDQLKAEEKAGAESGDGDGEGGESDKPSKSKKGTRHEEEDGDGQHEDVAGDAGDGEEDGEDGDEGGSDADDDDGSGDSGDGERGDGPGEDDGHGEEADGDDADADGDGAGSEEAEGGDPVEDGEPGEGEPGAHTGPAYEETGEETSLDLSDGDDAKPLDKADAIGEFVKKAAEEYIASGRTDYRVYTTEKDFIGPPDDPRNDEERSNLRRKIHDLTESVRFAFGPVTRTLENLLKARTQSYYVRGLEEGDLDASSLHRLATAQHSTVMRNQARHVFMQKVKARSLEDTAVSLSIDMSGSMRGGAGGYESKDMLAQKCAIVFAHALEGVDIPFEITAWSTQPHGTSESTIYRIKRELDTMINPKAKKVPCTAHEHWGGSYYGCPCCGGHGYVPEEYNRVFSLYSRYGGLRILEVKRFAEKWQHVDWRLTHVRGYHANYDGESVLLAARRLMTRKERRKVLFVMCDGIPGPDHSESPEVHARYLHEVVDHIRKETPIELVGIGIGAPAARQFYKPHFVNVEDASELPKVVADQLKAVLLK